MDMYKETSVNEEYFTGQKYLVSSRDIFGKSLRGFWKFLKKSNLKINKTPFEILNSAKNSLWKFLENWEDLFSKISFKAALGGSWKVSREWFINICQFKVGSVVRINTVDNMAN